MHPIYLGHGSSFNKIVDNSFVDIGGDVIRIRDYSNRNVIKGNRFDNVRGKWLVGEWYCNGAMRGQCMGSGASTCCSRPLDPLGGGECPSWGNVVSPGQEVANRQLVHILTNSRLEEVDSCRQEAEGERFVIE